LRRTNADKHRAVTLLLKDAEWQVWSDGEIARRCAVSDRFVAKIRKGLSPNCSGMRRVTRQGKSYTMDTSGIGAADPQITTLRELPPGMTRIDVPERVRASFAFIMVNPPWQSLDVAQVQSLPVTELATPAALLCLWTDNAHLPEAVAVVKAWGFDYRTAVTWVKRTPGTVDKKAVQTEHCLIAMRGYAGVEINKLKHALWQEGVVDLAGLTVFYEMVEQACPGPRAELFVRSNREGWAPFGVAEDGRWAAG
jgi:N6-adenosine-specific RNA methylase IME4